MVRAWDKRKDWPQVNKRILGAFIWHIRELEFTQVWLGAIKVGKAERWCDQMSISKARSLSRDVAQEESICLVWGSEFAPQHHHQKKRNIKMRGAWTCLWVHPPGLTVGSALLLCQKQERLFWLTVSKGSPAVCWVHGFQACGEVKHSYREAMRDWLEPLGSWQPWKQRRNEKRAKSRTALPGSVPSDLLPPPRPYHTSQWCY